MSEPSPSSSSPSEPPASRGLLIVVSGPSGVGKTTITHRLVERLHAVFSVSMTTRPKTEKDREGVDYYFVDEAHFREAVEQGDLLEWAEVFGHCYGTPRRPVDWYLAEGRDVVLEIDVAGAIQVKRRLPEAMTLFVLPPDEQTLLHRLRSRAREEESIIQRRFTEARREIDTARTCGAYDHFIINDRLDRAVDEACELIQRRKASASSGSTP
jgi:guanylate kinase